VGQHGVDRAQQPARRDEIVGLLERARQKAVSAMKGMRLRIASYPARQRVPSTAPPRRSIASAA
jgi:hypothetical protein